ASSRVLTRDRNLIETPACKHETGFGAIIKHVSRRGEQEIEPLIGLKCSRVQDDRSIRRKAKLVPDPVTRSGNWRISRAWRVLDQHRRHSRFDFADDLGEMRTDDDDN